MNDALCQTISPQKQDASDQQFQGYERRKSPRRPAEPAGLRGERKQNAVHQPLVRANSFRTQQTWKPTGEWRRGCFGEETGEGQV